MFEELIDKNRKIVVISFALIVVSLIVGVFYLTTTQRSDADQTERQESDLLESRETTYSNSLYTISNPDGPKNTITIDAYTGYRTAAINKLYDLGFDPTDFSVSFNNYESPFTPYE